MPTPAPSGSLSEPFGSLSGTQGASRPQNRSQRLLEASGGQAAPASSSTTTFCTARHPHRASRGSQLARVAGVLGFELHPWQRHVADVGLELDSNGNYQHRTVGAQVSRQNGKTALIWSRIVLEALAPKRAIAYTAQDRMAARDKLEELYEFLRYSSISDGITRFVGTNGRERIEFANGSVARITTPSRKAGRGLSLDLVVIDEALTIDPEVLSSLLPTMATRANAQLWLVSNAGIPGISQLLSRYRQIGHESLSSDDATIAWFEWTPALDSQGVMLGDPYEEEQWTAANPSLGLDGGVTLEALRDAARGLELHQFQREHLNLWSELDSAPVISLQVWEHLNRPDQLVSDHPILAVDVTPDRDRASIAAASKQLGLVSVEVVEAGDGVGWVLDRLEALAARWSAPVVIDGGAAAGSLIMPLEQRGITVQVQGARDYARACGTFHDLVADMRLCHRGDWRLTDAVKGASKRPLGDQWAWDRKGRVDISPLVAVTLAAYVAETHESLTPQIF